MKKTNKQKLEDDILHSVRRYAMDSHSSFQESAQLAIELLGKYAPIPDSMKQFAVKPVKKRFGLLKKMLYISG